jgi:hypothetical protein
MKAARRPLLLVALATFVAVGAFTGSASGRAQTVQFVSGNDRVVQGNQANALVAVEPNGARCSLGVRYKGGFRQHLPAVTVSGFKASWTWEVPRKAHTGVARVTASCGRVGHASKRLIVIGQVLPPSVQVVKTGWSARPYPFAGTGVSYGVILQNQSQKRDALDVNVLVNFVMADNRLIGSATSHISGISAGSQHALGGDLIFPGGAPIARLEVVVRIGKSGPPTHTRPAISAVRLVPSMFEPPWCGSIEGEIQNDSSTRTLQAAELTAVILDADGNVIGGASGYGGTQLPPSARVFFKLDSASRAVPLSKAASALVSVVPTYMQ